MNTYDPEKGYVIFYRNNGEPFCKVPIKDCIFLWLEAHWPFKVGLHPKLFKPTDPEGRFELEKQGPVNFMPSIRERLSEAHT